MGNFNMQNIDIEKYKKCANKLLNHCYIVKKKPDSREDYIFIIQNKKYFEEQFELLGYELLIDESNGVIGISNVYGTGRLRLKKIESIILLLIRLLYLEKKMQISLNDEVVILTSELQDKYSLLSIQGKPNIDKTALREAIRIFKRYNLILTLDSDVTKPDCRIIVYPSIFFALDTNSIDKLYERLEEKIGTYVIGVERQSDEETYED